MRPLIKSTTDTQAHAGFHGFCLSRNPDIIPAHNAHMAQCREGACRCCLRLGGFVAVISQDIPLGRCQIGRVDHVSARDFA